MEPSNAEGKKQRSYEFRNEKLENTTQFPAGQLHWSYHKPRISFYGG
jgi:hypothetical protein